MPMTLVLPDKHILSGRDTGKLVRERLHLDELDTNKKESQICILISESVWSINSSFFIGCFLESIKHLGSVEKFEEKYRFMCDKFLANNISDGESRCSKIIEYIKGCDENVTPNELPRYFYVQ